MSENAIQVVRDDQGVLTVLDAPKIVLFARDLLDEAAAGGCAPHLTVKDRLITVTASNGTWTYQIEGNPQARVVVGRLL